MAGLVDMAKTPEEVKEETSDWGSPVAASKYVEKYPWGLSISLDQDSLEKLGLAGALPQVGSVVKFAAEARVTSTSSSENETTSGETKQCQRVELQIIRMALPADGPRDISARASKWYGDAAPAAPDTDNDGE